MALISVSGVALPTPSEFSVGKMDISKAERNANGTMIIERVTTKTKLSISYAFVTASDLSLILRLIEPVFWDVTFLDPINNSMRTSSFYVGDRNMGMIDYQSGVARYQDVQFDFIER